MFTNIFGFLVVLILTTATRYWLCNFLDILLMGWSLFLSLCYLLHLSNSNILFSRFRLVLNFWVILIPMFVDCLSSFLFYYYVFCICVWFRMAIFYSQGFTLISCDLYGAICGLHYLCGFAFLTWLINFFNGVGGSDSMTVVVRIFKFFTENRMSIFIFPASSLFLLSSTFPYLKYTQNCLFVHVYWGLERQNLVVTSFNLLGYGPQKRFFFFAHRF